MMSGMHERITRLTLDGQQVRLRSGNLDRTPLGWRADWRIVAEVDGVVGQLSGERLVVASVAAGAPLTGRGLVNASVVVSAGVAVTLLDIVRTGEAEAGAPQ